MRRSLLLIDSVVNLVLGLVVAGLGAIELGAQGPGRRPGSQDGGERRRA